MPGEGWIRFEGYEGRLDAKYAGKYKVGGLKFPLIERTRSWDIVRVDGEPAEGLYRIGQYTVLSRGHDMMQKAHEEAAAYRLHFKRCTGVGVCQDIGHPGGSRRSMAQAIPTSKGIAPVETPPSEPPSELVEASWPAPRSDSSAAPTEEGDWTALLRPSDPIHWRTVGEGLALWVIPLEFELWQGPKLSMAEDCNKRGGRVVGDRGELSCAEVEIVKRFRAAGWDAAWVQSFKCGGKSWGAYIADLHELPPVVRAVQRIAGEAGGHPDVLAWSGERVVALESKGPSDALKASQIEWFARALEAGVQATDLGVVEWRVSTPAAARPSEDQPDPIVSPELAKALGHAITLHARQARKHTTIPYVSHLLAVCSLVLEDGGAEDEAIAALLHDGPEDQGGQATLDEIRRQFGASVAAMVDGLSDTLESPKPPWRERKERYLVRLREEPEAVLRVSLADKLHNLRSIAVDGYDVWSRFNADKAEQAWYFNALLAVFEERLTGSRNLPEFRRLVASVFRTTND